MFDIMIRESVPEDAEVLLAYLKQIGGESDNLTFGEEGLPITIEQERSFLKSTREDTHSVNLCVWKNGSLVGSGSLTGLPRRMGHRAELSISVAKVEWNSGIGTRLVEKLIAYAREHGIEILNLEVSCDNTAAIHLYEKFGFQHIGISPGFFKLGSQYIDFAMMYLDLRK